MKIVFKKSRFEFKSIVNLKELQNWFIKKFCLEAVKQDGDALQYVKEQSESICLEAVKRNGYALRYVKEQSESICLEAVKQDGDALQYVNINADYLEISE